MSRIKLAIFDMDGVLVDSEPAITLASMESLKEYGITANYEDFKPYTGMGTIYLSAELPNSTV